MSVLLTEDRVLLPSAARTATTTIDIDNVNSARGIVLYFNITAASGTGSVQVNLQGKDPASGVYINIGSSTAQTTANNTMAILYPGQSSSGNLYTSNICGVLPRTFRLRVIHADNSSYTYSVGASFLA